ncbi:hypothetical protein ES705_36228 [subsurface metagenome]
MNLDLRKMGLVADWAVQNMQNGIIALGLGGPEIGNPPSYVNRSILLCVLHSAYIIHSAAGGVSPWAFKVTSSSGAQQCCLQDRSHRQT